MFESGLVGEVQSLLAAGVDPTAPAMSAIGYREVVQLLNGEMDKTAAREAVALATRRLVRRQRQWFRRDDPRIRWVAGPDDIEMEANIFTGVCTNALRRSG
jgi:tRNA dimethylallyltransferase